MTAVIAMLGSVELIALGLVLLIVLWVISSGLRQGPASAGPARRGLGGRRGRRTATQRTPEDEHAPGG